MSQSSPPSHGAGSRDTLRNLLLAGAAFALIMALGPVLFPVQPPRPHPSNTESAVPVAGDPPGAAPTSITARGSDAAATGVKAANSPFSVLESQTEGASIVGSTLTAFTREAVAADPYRMRLVLSNVGASVESATMTDYAASVDDEARYLLLSPVKREPGPVYRSLGIERINLDGIDIRLGDSRWHGGEVVEAEAGQSVTYTIDVEKEAKPMLRLIRTFTLPKQPRSIGRHDLYSSLQVKNLSGEAHRVIVIYQGGVSIPLANPGTDDRVISLGLYDGVRVAGTYRTCAEAAKSGTLPLFNAAKSESGVRLSWAATGNTYFTCTVAPLSRTTEAVASYIADVSAVDLDGSPTTLEDVTLRFVTAVETVLPGGELQYPALLYVGEKDGDAFRAVPEYKARNFYFQVVQSYGSCTFTWLVELMVWLLNRLVWVVRDYGVAIIILVLLVRVLLHPITKKGQVNMVRMQQKMGEFAPKVEELKRKFANDKARLQQETMKLYREQGINPASNMLGCLPMVIQMPIWVALWISLSNNIQMRHQGFLYPLTWIQDLTAPDALYTFSSAIVVPLMGWQLPSFNLLPILLAIFMYLQQKYQPKPKPNPNMTDQQRQQQEMMQMMMPMMSIMMLLIFYKAPSGLSLYVLSSSVFGILEQRRIRKHLEAEEKRGGAGSAPAAQPSGGGATAPRRLSWLEKLQKMADDAGKIHSQRAAKGKPRR